MSVTCKRRVNWRNSELVVRHYMCQVEKGTGDTGYGIKTGHQSVVSSFVVGLLIHRARGRPGFERHGGVKPGEELTDEEDEEGEEEMQRPRHVGRDVLS